MLLNTTRKVLRISDSPPGLPSERSKTPQKLTTLVDLLAWGEKYSMTAERAPSLAGLKRSEILAAANLLVENKASLAAVALLAQATQSFRRSETTGFAREGLKISATTPVRAHIETFLKILEGQDLNHHTRYALSSLAQLDPFPKEKFNTVLKVAPQQHIRAFLNTSFAEKHPDAHSEVLNHLFNCARTQRDFLTVVRIFITEGYFSHAEQLLQNTSADEHPLSRAIIGDLIEVCINHRQHRCWSLLVDLVAVPSDRKDQQAEHDHVERWKAAQRFHMQQLPSFESLYISDCYKDVEAGIVSAVKALLIEPFKQLVRHHAASRWEMTSSLRANIALCFTAMSAVEKAASFYLEVQDALSPNWAKSLWIPLTNRFSIDSMVGNGSTFFKHIPVNKIPLEVLPTVAYIHLEAKAYEHAEYAACKYLNECTQVHAPSARLAENVLVQLFARKPVTPT